VKKKPIPIPIPKPKIHHSEEEKNFLRSLRFEGIIVHFADE
jgi:hypothetical protein